MNGQIKQWYRDETSLELNSIRDWNFPVKYTVIPVCVAVMAYTSSENYNIAATQRRISITSVGFKNSSGYTATGVAMQAEGY